MTKVIGRTKVLSICVGLILFIWLVVLTIQFMLFRAEYNIENSLRIGRAIPQNVQQKAQYVIPINSSTDWKPYHMTPQLKDGSIVTLRFFGGTYLYIALNSQDEVVDYYWHRT